MKDTDNEEGAYVLAVAALRLDDAVTDAWGIIANVSGGDWSKQNPEWQAAARRWYQTYMMREL
jgi:hypothetical protein